MQKIKITDFNRLTRDMQDKFRDSLRQLNHTLNCYTKDVSNSEITDIYKRVGLDFEKHDIGLLNYPCETQLGRFKEPFLKDFETVARIYKDFDKHLGYLRESAVYKGNHVYIPQSAWDQFAQAMQLHDTALEGVQNNFNNYLQDGFRAEVLQTRGAHRIFIDRDADKMRQAVALQKQLASEAELFEGVLEHTGPEILQAAKVQQSGRYGFRKTTITIPTTLAELEIKEVETHLRTSLGGVIRNGNEITVAATEKAVRNALKDFSCKIDPDLLVRGPAGMILRMRRVSPPIAMQEPVIQVALETRSEPALQVDEPAPRSSPSPRPAEAVIDSAGAGNGHPALPSGESPHPGPETDAVRDGFFRGGGKLRMGRVLGVGVGAMLSAGTLYWLLNGRNDNKNPEGFAAQEDARRQNGQPGQHIA